jgi:hypothetical protein
MTWSKLPNAGKIPGEFRLNFPEMVKIGPRRLKFGLAVYIQGWKAKSKNQR